MDRCCELQLEALFETSSSGAGLHVVLLRHAQTLWNEQLRIQGHLDSPFSDKGRRQVREWAEKLGPLPWDAVLSSDLGRASKTAQGIARVRGLHVIRDPRLREMDWGEWAGLTKAALRDRHPGRRRIRHRSDCERGAPGGESPAQLHDRATDALRELASRHPGGRILAVTHSGWIKVVLHAIADAEMFSNDMAHGVDYAAYVIAHHHESGWRYQGCMRLEACDDGP